MTDISKREAIVGIDVGGTFTDLYFSREGDLPRILKVPSVPNDPSMGLINALTAAAIDGDEVGLIVHGTTIATNALIERKGARCALITTSGFRDVLELGRRDRPRMYGLSGVQRPLIPRDRRYEIDERLDAKGQVLTPLNREEVIALGQKLADDGIEAVVISFLHAYANPVHEQSAATWLTELNAGFEVVQSHAVCNEYYEFERTSTAAVQGYLQPLVAGYGERLGKRLAKTAFPDEPLIMQSNGGVTPLKQVGERAANIVRSGPAAGVTAAAALARDAGFNHVITGDMGGTSFDVAVVVDGVPKVARTSKLDFRIVLKLPMIDVHTIGAGGGSIASLDPAGILQVGPESAGAKPGPAAYGHGGALPTVTDANVVLGRINWQSPLGDRPPLDLESARVVVGSLGESLGLSLEPAAEAILSVVNHTMARRTRLLSVEQGLDPRDFALVIFGGAGPLHGAAIMREVGISKMLVPPEPGVLCAVGCCIANIRYDEARTIECDLAELSGRNIGVVLDDLEAAGEEKLAEADFHLGSVNASFSADMCYLGQIHNLRVPIQRDWSPMRLAEAFSDAYRSEFGNTLRDIPVILVSLQATISAPPPSRVVRTPQRLRVGKAIPFARRNVYFGKWCETEIYRREDLVPGITLDGPAVVEQADATIVIEPGMTASVDTLNNLLVEVCP